MPFCGRQSEDNLLGCVFSFHHVGPRDGTQDEVGSTWSHTVTLLSRVLQSQALYTNLSDLIIIYCAKYKLSFFRRVGRGIWTALEGEKGRENVIKIQL